MSPTDALARQVIEIIAETRDLDRKRISLGSTFEELGFDSLDGITLAFALEEALDVEIPDESVRGLQTVGEVVDNLRRLIGRGPDV